ncbi:MAG: putative sugar nucleotidyl transferase, partial [Thermoguttaceae bacterium]
MHIILFEDHHVPQLYPVTVSKPAFALTVGSYKLIDIVSRLDAAIEAVVRQHLHSLVEEDYPHFWKHEKNGCRQGPILLLNARAVPHVRLIDQIKKLIEHGRSGVVMNGQQIACVLLLGATNQLPNQVVGPRQLTGLIEDMQLAHIDADIALLEYTHDLVRYQMRYLNENLNDRLATEKYKEIENGVFTAGNVSIGDYHIFDTKHGPIILEDGVNIGPYCFIRGPVYIGEKTKVIEHSAIKDFVTVMSTAKVGGEVEASTIESYSNKQHHGFLGHSYLGNWINLG